MQVSQIRNENLSNENNEKIKRKVNPYIDSSIKAANVSYSISAAIKC